MAAAAATAAAAAAGAVSPGSSVQSGMVAGRAGWPKERAATEHAMARTNVDIKLPAVAKPNAKQGTP